MSRAARDRRARRCVIDYKETEFVYFSSYQYESATKWIPGILPVKLAENNLNRTIFKETGKRLHIGQREILQTFFHVIST